MVAFLMEAVSVLKSQTKQTMTRGYTDEADKLMNYLVHIPYSDWSNCND